MSFNTLVDQGGVVRALKAAVSAGRLAHAMLFLGPAGSGRRAAARELTKVLFCEARTEGLEPCDTCPPCRLIESGAHPDYHVLEPDPETGNIRIEPVREIIAMTGLRPLQAPAKVFVIADAERMNEYAQSALLKTLEEPPGATHIILISSFAEGLLPTIRSRSQLFRFRPLGDTAPAGAEALGRVEEALAYALSSGEGERLLPPEWSGLEREEAVGAVDLLARYFREVLIGREGVRFFGGIAERVRVTPRLEAAMDEASLEEMLSYLGECREQLAANVNLRLFFGVFWGRLRSELSAARVRMSLGTV